MSMRAIVAADAPPRDSAKAGAVVRLIAPHLGLTPASAHQHLQRIRRELPRVVRVAFGAERHQWIDWLLGPTDVERLATRSVTPDLRYILTKGSIDRTEDCAREAYLVAQDLETARELDARLEKEMIAIANTRRFLFARHPELRS